MLQSYYVVNNDPLRTDRKKDTFGRHKSHKSNNSNQARHCHKQQKTPRKLIVISESSFLGQALFEPQKAAHIRSAACCFDGTQATV